MLPALFIHPVGVGEAEGQVADQRPQHRVGLTELSLHCRGVDHVDHRVGPGNGGGGALALTHDRGHLALIQGRQHQPLVRPDLHRTCMDEIQLVAPFGGLENHVTLFEGFADHIHDKFHRDLPALQCH